MNRKTKSPNKAVLHSKASHSASPKTRRPTVLRVETNDTEIDNQAIGQYTPGELSVPDQQFRVGQDNPQGVEGGRGPLQQDGEGNRQNDQLAELEDMIDAAKDLESRR